MEKIMSIPESKIDELNKNLASVCASHDFDYIKGLEAVPEPTSDHPNAVSLRASFKEGCKASVALSQMSQRAVYRTLMGALRRDNDISRHEVRALPHRETDAFFTTCMELDLFFTDFHDLEKAILNAYLTPQNLPPQKDGVGGGRY
jgi:hypothetical protein